MLWFLWVSSVAYPNLLGLKDFVVVVKNNHIWKYCDHTTGRCITVHKASIFTFSKSIEDTFT
jgi:hypothetical protein